MILRWGKYAALKYQWYTLLGEARTMAHDRYSTNQWSAQVGGFCNIEFLSWLAPIILGSNLIWINFGEIGTKMGPIYFAFSWH